VITSFALAEVDHPIGESAHANIQDHSTPTIGNRTAAGADTKTVWPRMQLLCTLRSPACSNRGEITKSTLIGWDKALLRLDLLDVRRPLEWWWQRLADVAWPAKRSEPIFKAAWTYEPQ
jgi:hypothetical protein